MKKFVGDWADVAALVGMAGMLYFMRWDASGIMGLVTGAVISWWLASKLNDGGTPDGGDTA